MNSNVDVRFVKVDEKTLVEFLNNAKKRIIIAKAGYRDLEVKTLVDLVDRKNLECRVYIDPGENAVRWGFGQQSALKELTNNSEKLNVQTADHIRMSVVIVDDSALIYSPVALSWETEPEEMVFPNGFIGGSKIADSLLEQINATEEESPPISDKVVPFPGCTIPKKETVETKKELSDVIKKLEKNPPVDPSKLRKVTVYRNNYKILKFQIKGVKIRNKSISLRLFNSLFSDLSERLKASWRIFTKKDMTEIKGISIFLEEANSIVENYTLDIGRFGRLIKAEDKNDFEKDIENEKVEFLEILKLKPNAEPENKESKYLDVPIIQGTLFKETEQPKRQNLGTLLELSRKSLRKYMFQMIKDNPGSEEGLFKNDKTLLKMVKEGEMELNKILPGVLDMFITHRLKFPDADELLEKMDIKTDYYDVSNEMLYEDDEFKEILKRIKNSKNPSNELKIRNFSEVLEEEDKDS